MSQRASLPVRLVLGSRVFDRAGHALALLRNELALALLDGPGRRELETAIYAAASQFLPNSAFSGAGLRTWEDDAISRFFPMPPARILVAGCGGGREVCALLDRGHEVCAAYDPVPGFVAGLEAELRRRNVSCRTWVGAHEDLARERCPSVDAVLVGWTSYAHIIGAVERRALLRALAEACPRGPVLLSFPAPRPRASRAADLARRVVRRLARSELELGDRFEPVNGFVHYFEREELEDEARSAGYRVAHYDDRILFWSHAVLVRDAES